MAIVKRVPGTSEVRARSVAADAQAAKEVDIDPTVPELPSEPDGPVKILRPAAVPDWRGSSWDLLNGVEVSDETDSIPGELFDSLFRR